MSVRAESAEYLKSVRGVRVYRTTTGRVFIHTRTVRGTRRTYGFLRDCEHCQREFFSQGLGRKCGPERPAQRFCSNKCSKVGEYNPMRRDLRKRRTIAKHTADKWFARIIRHAGTCLACGESDPRKLQCAHVFSRGYLAIRWTEDNAVCLCAGCHMRYTHAPIEWEDFCISHLGEQKYRELRLLALTQEKVDYEALLDRLIGRLAELGLEAAA